MLHLFSCCFVLLGRREAEKNKGPSKLVDGQSSLQQLKRQISKQSSLGRENEKRRRAAATTTEAHAKARVALVFRRTSLSLRSQARRTLWPPFYSIDSTTSFAGPIGTCFVNTCHFRGPAHSPQFKRALRFRTLKSPAWSGQTHLNVVVSRAAFH